MFEFNEFLAKTGIDPERVRLLRHDVNGLAAWRRGGHQTFGCFASFQKRTTAPYGGADLACHFLPAPNFADGSMTALFIGVTRILDRWEWDGNRLPRLRDDAIITQETNFENVDAFDLEWLPDGADFAERIVINWGRGARAWSQWAHRNVKPILELRLQRQEPPFPGFAAFIARIGEIPTFPQSWVGALENVRGVYLLVTDSGEQYVGSATGADGFIGRWRQYLGNGHGGNVLLRAAGHRDYTVTILDLASPDMALEDILAREAFWKAKLGARAHGLNAN